MTEPESERPAEKTGWPPLAVWASMIIVGVFTVAFLLSVWETLVFVAQKTPVVTRVFYLFTYGTFYFWPILTVVFMARARYWAWISSQFLLILIMLSLGFFTFSFIAQAASRGHHLELLSAAGFSLVFGVFLWNVRSQKVKDFYRA
ncbi:MAG: hypothetical protein J0L75_01385 [Spirochaetes bacterium]|nr:hypothetical protein [Spirochaetota bacterium]